MNEEQLKVFEEVINGNNRVVLTTGEAGTGKSFLIQKIVETLKETKDILVTATTNKAKNNLQETLNLQCFTTQSALGFLLLPKGRSQVLSDVREAKEADIIIIDEVSMIQPNVYKKLLKSKYKKILLFGDFAQLEPVGEKTTFNLLDFKTFKLTKQMRQENKQLTSKLQEVRKTISTKCLIDIHNLDNERIVLTKDHSEFCEIYKQTIDGTKKILAYKNATIDAYNNNINNGIKFKLEDNIILDKPLYPFLTGDTVTITDIEEKDTLFKLQINNSAYIYVYKTKKLEAEILDKTDEENYWNLKNKIFNPKLEYASTIHKAQGMNIDYVFIDITDIYSQLTKRITRFSPSKPLSVEEYNRLVYVALSRVKKKIFLFIGEKRNYKKLRS